MSPTRSSIAVSSMCIALNAVVTFEAFPAKGTVVLHPVTRVATAEAPVQLQNVSIGGLQDRTMEARPGGAQPPRPGQPVPITIRPAMLVDNIEELAGQNVKILNARVVGVFEPHAFLIESAGRYAEMLGRRDRILVLLEAAMLRVPAESIVASTVRVFGVAHTLLGARMDAESRWPTKLDRALVERLEVRAAVFATSVQTAEGTELTDRPPTAPDAPF
jgi:hypothetical protein